MRLLAVLLGWLALTTSAYAAGKDIYVGCVNDRTNVSADEIKMWLRSGDDRLIAWGAYFAGQSKDEGVLTLLERILQGASVRGEEDPHVVYGCMIQTIGADRDAYILDALIQRKAVIPTAALTDTIRAHFSLQALILTSWMPAESSTSLLEKWYYEGSASAYPLQFKRVVAMMLSKSPPPGFLASLLAGSEKSVLVYVTDDVNAVNPQSTRVKPVAETISKKILCGSPAGPHPEGLPPRMQYSISENEPAKDGNPGFSDVLVEAGGDTIRYLISSSEEPRYSDCPAALNSENKGHLLMEMLGPDAARVPWTVDKTITILWQDNASYLLALRREVEAEQAEIHAELKMFADKGLLDRSEIDAVAPRLVVDVRDERKVRWDRNHPVLLLPKLKLSDRNVVQIP